jgi:thioredoxin reductase (NADPH)
MKKILILGSGCAGLTASIYIARSSFRPVVVEGNKIGGQLMDTDSVENFPGFPKKLTGYSLINRIKKQALRFGVRFINANVLFINLKGFLKKFYLNNEFQINCMYVLVAVGSSNKFLNVYGESDLYCRGISTCATCDGFLTKNKLVVVVGGGDSACEEALFLSKIARRVVILCRKNSLRASFFLRKKVFLNKKIFFI